MFIVMCFGWGFWLFAYALYFAWMLIVLFFKLVFMPIWILAKILK